MAVSFPIGKRLWIMPFDSARNSRYRRQKRNNQQDVSRIEPMLPIERIIMFLPKRMDCMAVAGFKAANSWSALLFALALGLAPAKAAEPANIQYNSPTRYCEAKPSDSRQSSRQNALIFSTSSQIVPAQAVVPLPKVDQSPPQEQTFSPTPLVGGAALPETAAPLSLQTALEWTLSANPDLIALRQNFRVSNDALAVARSFPMSLNPTVSLTLQPWTFERMPGQGVEQLATLFSVSWQQPIEIGHRTEYRTAIAQASFSQTRWNILQAELLAMVQTYRLHQAAAYRYRKYSIATRLAEFNERLLQALERQLQANRVSAADVVLAKVENQATLQSVETARREYVAAIAELCRQIGAPRYVGTFEIGGELQTPDLPGAEVEDALVKSALQSRPEILAARAQASGSHAAVALARADRIPIPSIGPVYEKDESNVTYYGVGISSPIPVLNAGTKIVRQRESEHCRDLVSLEQTRQKVVAQVKTALMRCQEARRFSAQTNALAAPLAEQAARMDRLYEAGQSDLVKLFQVRQRLIEAENVRIDADWQVIQAYADMLDALGATPLVAAIPLSK
jgi:outer membrane protein, heavy metal efflux system